MKPRFPVGTPVGITLLCDVCCRSSVCHHETDTEEALKEAVSTKAREEGWTVVDEVATCPACRKRGLN